MESERAGRKRSKLKVKFPTDTEDDDLAPDDLDEMGN